MSKRIFISYKRDDKDVVSKIKDNIEKHVGEKCWIDLDGIESDAQFVNVIINAIDEADVFLFMYSKKHAEITDFENDWTVREINYAQVKKKRIIFLNIDSTSLSDWFVLMFGLKQQVNVSSNTAMNKLYSDLRMWLGIKKEEPKFKYDEPIEWIDFNQYLINNNLYKLKILVRSLFFVVLLITCLSLFIFLSVGFYINTGNPQFNTVDQQMFYATGLEYLLLKNGLIYPYCYHGDCEYLCPDFEMNILFGCLLVGFIISLILYLLYPIFIKKCLFIEQNSKSKFYKLAKLESGKYLLVSKKHLMPFGYSDEIRYCGNNIYIFANNGKMGVFNADKRRLVLSMIYDVIEILPNNNLKTIKSGIVQYFTMEGKKINN